MRVPWLEASQQIVRQPVSQIDTVPTLLDLMGVERPAALQGQSLVPLMKGGRVDEDHVFIEWNWRGYRKVKNNTKLATRDEIDRVAQACTRTVVSPDGWKLCLSDHDKCQLFNLDQDPGETTNLFDSGRHQDVIDRLAARIHAWQKRTGDTLSLPV